MTASWTCIADALPDATDATTARMDKSTHLEQIQHLAFIPSLICDDGRARPHQHLQQKAVATTQSSIRQENIVRHAVAAGVVAMPIVVLEKTSAEVQNDA